MNLYFDRQGEPMTLMEWAAELETSKPIASTEIGEHLVSTIWIGLNTAITAIGGGSPLIFETCVFLDDELLSQERYATEQEAEDGHARIVAKLEKDLE